MDTLIPLAAIAGVIIWWCLICYAIALWGGWRALAGRYTETAATFRGETKDMQSGVMRWKVRLNGVLTIGADARGVYLAMFFLFRVGHPPLFIPWNEIAIEERRVWWQPATVLNFTSVPGVYLAVFEELRALIAEQRGRVAPLQ